jgi:hypothetical protein
MLSRQEEEIERREVLENDRLVREQQKQREQSGTYLSHTHVDEISGGGRYAVINPTVVTGANPTLRYPAAGPHQHDPVPTEPPLGYSVDDMPIELSAVPVTAVEQLGGAAAAPSASSSLLPNVERAAPPSFSEDSDNG